jgi:hypothetical protein
MRKLYVMTALVVLEINGRTDIQAVPGILLAENEDEAKTQHLEFVTRECVGYTLRFMRADLVPDKLFREAAKEWIRNAELDGS